MSRDAGMTLALTDCNRIVRYIAVGRCSHDVSTPDRNGFRSSCLRATDINRFISFVRLLGPAGGRANSLPVSAAAAAWRRSCESVTNWCPGSDIWSCHMPDTSRLAFDYHSSDFYTPRSAGGKALWVARRPPNDIDDSKLDCGRDPAVLSHGHQLAMIFGVAVFLRGSERVTGAEMLRLKPFGNVNKTTAVKIGAVQDKYIKLIAANDDSRAFTELSTSVQRRRWHEVDNVATVSSSAECNPCRMKLSSFVGLNKSPELSVITVGCTVYATVAEPRSVEVYRAAIGDCTECVQALCIVRNSAL